ncbi:hypothetical protein RER_pREC1-00900 (plasmid) [Rhodococcus erythropolis PR4]|uniref:Uncharacterized protein n=1 Tax=Rhodococcus erythropolis (strain PR4 / NBRC 100887) TaxID=234621 RepID=Q3L8Y2_RHOE4|nr:hypothetical protein RER_pREC1-00900 [Rhodococcus erythropolis PR4]
MVFSDRPYEHGKALIVNEVSSPGNAVQRGIHYLCTLPFWKSMITPLVFGIVTFVVFLFSESLGIALIGLWVVIIAVALVVEWRYSKTLRDARFPT